MRGCSVDLGHAGAGLPLRKIRGGALVFLQHGAGGQGSDLPHGAAPSDQRNSLVLLDMIIGITSDGEANAKDPNGEKFRAPFG